MKIIPKFQSGKLFDSFFTIYKPVGEPQLKKTTESSSKGSSSVFGKGELTEKDLFNMIKDIDGLPNEMKSITNRLLATFLMDNLTGISSTDLATLYLQSLYLIKVASLNKETYENALKRAEEKGALHEPAITPDGKLVVLDKNGKISTVSLELYNKGKYYALTVSNLANMRAFDPSLAYNLTVFNIISNSTGFEEVLKLIDSAIKSLGSTETTRNGILSTEASQGLALLQTLREDDRVQALGSITLEGLYKYKIIDKDLLVQIEALKKYITSVLPDRVKTWAALKTGLSNKNKAIEDLVLLYMFGKLNIEHTFDIDYKGSTVETLKSKSSSSSLSLENPKEGYWVQVLTGKGGDDTSFNILSNRVLLSVDGKYYGTTPGLDKNKSFNDYLTDSGIRNVIKNMKNITFGDIQISSDNYNDVVVDANGGVMVTTLPITPEGKVDFSVLDTYTEILNKLKEEGLTPDTPEYNKLMAENLVSRGLEYLVNTQSGTIDMNKFGHFLILKGFTSDKALAIKSNKKVSIEDMESLYIIDSSDDELAYSVISDALSTKDDSYSLDLFHWYLPTDWGIIGGYDKIYSGNIFIPLNMNTINGMNADDNDIKASTALEYERNMQLIQKANSQRPTGSDLL